MDIKEHIFRPNHLRVQDINYRLNPSYSPNLYRWMNRNTLSDFIDRYRINGEEYLGCWDDTESFLGNRLSSILCDSTPKMFCYTHFLKGVVEYLPLWDEYISRGRCAIDPDHETSFIDKRYEQGATPDERVCKWCSAKFYAVYTPYTELRKSWRLAKPLATPRV